MSTPATAKEILRNNYKSDAHQSDGAPAVTTVSRTTRLDLLVSLSHSLDCFPSHHVDEMAPRRDEGSTDSQVSENTPLLAEVPPLPIDESGAPDLEGIVGDGGKADDDDGVDDEEVPLPRLQIFLLCFARLVEPIAFFGIFPFIAQMIWETGGMEESDVGFYSGLIVCWSLVWCFCLAVLRMLLSSCFYHPAFIFLLSSSGVYAILIGMGMEREVLTWDRNRCSV